MRQERGVAHRPARERDALQRGDVGEDREHPQRRLEEIQERAGDEADQAFGALHHPDAALDADGLGPRLRITHHHAADQRGHGEDRSARVGRAREEHDDAEQDDEVRVTVDHRVEEGAERRDLAGGAGQRSVEEVEQAGQDQEQAGAAGAPGDEGRGRQQAHAEAGQREVVGTQVQPEQRVADGSRPGTETLAVTAQHARIPGTLV